MSVSRRIDSAIDLLAKWERRLEREGLRAITNGEGMYVPEPGRHDLGSRRARAGAYVSIRNDLDDEHAETMGTLADLTAAIDKLLAAVWRFKFDCRKDRRICQLLSQGLAWQEVARRVRCSKRRVARVNRQVQAWTDPE